MSSLLIVDDDPLFASSVRMKFKEALRVMTARSLSEVDARTYSKDSFDLVLLDRHLPDGDGWGRIQQWKQRWPDARFAMISGQPTSDDERALLMSYGIERVLLKSIHTIHELDGWIGSSRSSELGQNQVEPFTSRAAMRAWYQNASVRRYDKDKLCLTAEDVMQPLFCLDGICPGLKQLSTSSVKFYSGWRNFEAIQLRRHLEFTTHLELDVVSEALKDIAFERIGVHDSLKNEAFKLITDEAFHAQRTRELLASLEQWIPPESSKGWDSISFKDDPFIKIIGMELRRFFYCFVSETLISNILKENSQLLTQPALKEFFVEHLRDETRHSIFFQISLQSLWNHLGAELRSEAINCIAYDLKTYLIPQWGQIISDMRLCGLSEIVDSASFKSLHNKNQELIELSENAKPTIEALFKIAGRDFVLEHPSMHFVNHYAGDKYV